MRCDDDADVGVGVESGEWRCRDGRNGISSTGDNYFVRAKGIGFIQLIIETVWKREIKIEYSNSRNLHSFPQSPLESFSASTKAHLFSDSYSKYTSTKAFWPYNLDIRAERAP